MKNKKMHPLTMKLFSSEKDEEILIHFTKKNLEGLLKKVADGAFDDLVPNLNGMIMIDRNIEAAAKPPKAEKPAKQPKEKKVKAEKPAKTTKKTETKKEEKPTEKTETADKPAKKPVAKKLTKPTKI